jgi:hypothetical protein
MRALQLRAATLIAEGSEKDEPISSVDCPPPCFSSSRQYQEWLELESSAPVSKRKDFPAEPNYCRDCSPEGQAEMRAAGRCLFPLVRFQPKTNPEGEHEVVGYTPQRFLPKDDQGSFGHAIERVDEKIFELRWHVLANGSEQTKFVDEKTARTFAERWGLDFNPQAGDP